MSTKKPVNDLIKFWADKQDKEGEPISRSPRRPLSPSSSLPPSPLNDSFYSKSYFKDIPSNTPPLTPTHDNIHSLTSSEESDNNNISIDNNNDGRSIVSDNSNSRSIVTQVDIQTSSNNNDLNDSLTENISEKDPPNEEISNNITKKTDITTKDYNRKPNDYDFKIKDKISSLPPARKVTDLVSKFEKVSTPTNSVPTSPRLPPLKRGQTYVQSSPTSPLALSPINRNQLTPESLSLTLPNSSALNAKTKRRQTVPEPLNFKFSDEPSSSSSSNSQTLNNYESTPISPLSLEPTSTLNIIQQPPQQITTQNTKQTTKQTHPIKQQRHVSFKNDDNDDDNNNSNQKNVSESKDLNLDPIKKSDPEPLRQKTRHASLTKLDDFLKETFNNSTFNLTDEKSSEITSIWKPTNETKPVSPLKKSDKSIITKRSNTVPKNKSSRGITNDTSKINLNNYEIPDLLPQPEPISPIRLNFSDFLANGSSTNLNSNSSLDEKLNSKVSTQDGEKGKQNNNALIYKVVVETKSEVPKKNENSKSLKHISGTIHFIENLKRYLQPNKNKNSDDISVSTKKFTSQDINNDNQLNQIY